MILVTGANGFIGSRIVDGFGSEAIAASRTKRAEGETVIVDLTDETSVDACIAKLTGKTITHIIHAAAVTPFATASEPDYSQDITMAKAVVKVCVQLNVPYLFFLSGWVVYDPKVSVPITEESLTNPDSDYGKSKLAVEEYLAKNLVKTKLVCLRVASLYGPGQLSAGLIPNLVKNALQSGMITINALTTKRDYLHIDNLVQAVKDLIGHDFGDPITLLNIGSGKSVSVKEVADAVVAGFSAQNNHIQLQVAEILNESPVTDNQLDTSRARAIGVLNNMTTFDKGIKEYIAWKSKI